MLKAAGFTDSDLSKPLVGVVNSWAEVTPCNMHLRELAKSSRRDRAAGGTPHRVQHHRGVRWNHHGHSRDAWLSHLTRSHRGLRRTVVDSHKWMRGGPLWL